MPKDDREQKGYKIYLRVPEDAPPEEVSRVLREFAELLADERSDLSVEPYDHFYDPKRKVPQPACASKQPAGGDEPPPPPPPPHVVGGPKSPLVPLYVCHNRT